MSAAAAAPVPVFGLVGFLAFLAIERVRELVLSSLHVRRLLARGAREYGRGHFPAIVVMHALFPLALVAEVVWLGARPGPLLPLWFALFVIAQLLRASSMLALGDYWTARVLVVPGATPVRSGPYRLMRHPNYVAVAIELASAPLMFGAWRTALAFTLANLAALTVRIRCEERAWGEAGAR